ncbi:hypothetical protein BH09BAC6_BH09BAC6_07870 [soil metagenome]
MFQTAAPPLSGLLPKKYFRENSIKNTAYAVLDAFVNYLTFNKIIK